MTRISDTSSTPLTIAVLGANGRVGSAVAREAHRRGHTVIAVTRSGLAEHTPASENRRADAADAAALTDAIRGASVVFNGLNLPYPRWHREALPMARRVLVACEATGARQLFPGNVYNYGSTMPELLTASTPQRPDTPQGRVRVEMERLFERAAQDGRVRTTILRAGDFFGGPVRGSWFDLSIVSKLKKGTFTYPGPLDLPHAWAYLPDLASAFVDLAEQDTDLPAFSTATFAGHMATGQDLQDAVTRAAGRTLRTAHLPWPMIRVMGLVQPMMREIARIRYLWSTPHRLEGPISATPLDRAVAEALADLDRP